MHICDHRGKSPPMSFLVSAFDIRNMSSERDTQRLISCLPDDRRKRMERYLRENDRKRCAAGQLLAEYTVQCFSGKRIERSRFRRGENGKPFLESMGDLHFNISHSGSWVCCVAANVPVGIDVEKIRPVSRGVWNLCLTGEERQILERKSVDSGKGSDDLPPEQAKQFIQIWTIKESYLKMTGEGLLRPMDSFSVRRMDKYWTVEVGRTVSVDGDGICPCIILSQKWEQEYYLSMCFKVL